MTLAVTRSGTFGPRVSTYTGGILVAEAEVARMRSNRGSGAIAVLVRFGPLIVVFNSGCSAAGASVS